MEGRLRCKAFQQQQDRLFLQQRAALEEKLLLEEGPGIREAISDKARSTPVW